MKTFISIFCLISFIGSVHITNAQEAEVFPSDYKKRNALYDYTEKQLNNVDTIPGFNSKLNKIKISGTIYQSDGKTPAKDVILYVYQPDENGDYDMRRDEHRKRYVHNRGWVKTDSDGHYTLYTYIPGKFTRKELKQIHRVVKEPGKPEYKINSFFFNDDPLLPSLTLACRAKAVSGLLRLEKKDNLYVATKDIRLHKDYRQVQ
ncbi:hypothetical protein VOI54_13980 [Tamlana sp. 2201CG12-4]|uniref:hypothetical protein n=1 Tax=Tamlana sp. 2201CG12-4 TaxID=3112582 RepID=UPI002DBB65E3|nr:hypothetical protein [Tamlana sp. 2201CG12-4]MEC3908135.1 hypothetical protein [Tamlana sp. 2201CG12-4]